jgi:hypothetical protein
VCWTYAAYNSSITARELVAHVDQIFTRLDTNR